MKASHNSTINVFEKYNNAQNKLEHYIKDKKRMEKPKVENLEKALERVEKKKPTKKKTELSELHSFLLSNHHSLKGLSSQEINRILTEKFLSLPPEKVQNDVDKSIKKLKKYYDKKVIPEL